MSHLEKLRADVEYWEKADQEARETLRITDGLLPDLRKRLAALEAQLADTDEVGTKGDAEGPPKTEPGAEAPADSSDAVHPEGDVPRFTGECIDQVEQALRWKAPQSSHNLRDTLAEYGRDYGLGAIGYALRELRKQGKIREAKKEGNLRFYEPAPRGPVSMNPLDMVDYEEEGVAEGPAAPEGNL